MINKKITTQDIANRLNISRNTVSKALNNTGVISDTTRAKVIETAIDMGYKQFAYLNSPPTNDIKIQNKEIALFTCNMPNSSHFGFNLLSGFEKAMSSKGFRLSIYMIRENELNSLSFPVNFDPNSVAGIICIEMFDYNYSKLICNLNIPTLFIDSPLTLGKEPLNADILLMENHNSVYRLTKKLIENNITNIGFIGDNYHCQSFYERWQGYCSALVDSGISINTENSILENDNNPYTSAIWFKDKLDKFEYLPKAFICANDFIAISLIKSLEINNISVPDDILICGFDDSQESKIITPQLTTISIPNNEMGDIAADLLLLRIKNASAPYRTIHVNTSIKYRKSTGNLLFKKSELAY